MAKPIINGIGIAVHKTDNFYFTIKGLNFAVGDSVRLTRAIAGVKYEWTGSIVSREAGSDTYVAEITGHPSGFPGAKGSVGGVTILVTSSTGETSLAHDEDAVYDIP